MVYGYARVSTKGQEKNGNSLENQINELKVAGAEKIFVDAFTGAKTHRPEFGKMLSVVTEKDKIIVCKLDRFCRSISAGNEIITDLLNRGVSIHILNMGVLDNSPTSALLRNIMLCFGEFERSLILERTSSGKEIARSKPDFREGRPKLYRREQINHALSLLSEYSYKQVEALTGISKSTLIRAKKQLNYESEL